MKICTRCELEKPIEEFTTRTGTITTRCKKCKRELGKVWNDKNRDKIKENKKRLYHASIEESRRKGREESARFRKNSPEKKALHSKRYHEKNREKILEKMKVRSKRNYEKNPEKRKVQIEEWKRQNPEKKKAYSRKGNVVEKLRYPEKDRARKKVEYAIKSGRLTRPSNCSRCDSGEGMIEAHHTDYSKPLEVVWLCRKCHVAEHRKDDNKKLNLEPQNGKTL